MDSIDNALYITSFIRDYKTLLSISIINKSVYNIIRSVYYRKKIIESYIGKEYISELDYIISMPFIDMVKSLNKVMIGKLLVAYVDIEDNREVVTYIDTLGNNAIVCDNISDLIKSLLTKAFGELYLKL